MDQLCMDQGSGGARVHCSCPEDVINKQQPVNDIGYDNVPQTKLVCVLVMDEMLKKWPVCNEVTVRVLKSSLHVYQKKKLYNSLTYCVLQGGLKLKECDSKFNETQ